MSTDATPDLAPPVAVADAPAGEQQGKKRKGRQKQDKKPYRAEGAPKLTVWPADFDARIHQPLQVSDFDAEDVFWDTKAEEYAKRSHECKQKAELFRKFGTAEKRKTAEKAHKLVDKLAALKAELAADGIQISDLDLDLSALLN